MQAASILQQHSSVYSIVTEQILKQLESGVAPWHRPWSAQIPKNLVSGRGYRGINVFLLSASGYGSPYWLTYKQAAAIGAQVQRGEKGTPVVKFGQFQREDTQTGETKTGTYLKVYSVFNVSQCDGIELPHIERPKLASNGGATVELLKVLLRMTSERHGVAAKVIATVDDLDRIAADDAADVPAMHGWRRELFGDKALALKHGQLALAVEDGKVIAMERDKDFAAS